MLMTSKTALIETTGELTLVQAISPWIKDLQRVSNRHIEIRKSLWKGKYECLATGRSTRVCTVQVSTPCSQCGFIKFWTFCWEPDLWRCQECHPWENAEQIVKLVVDDEHEVDKHEVACRGGLCYDAEACLRDLCDDDIQNLPYLSQCGSTAWWYRQPSQWGPGQWLCSRCHPNPEGDQ